MSLFGPVQRKSDVSVTVSLWIVTAKKAYTVSLVARCSVCMFVCNDLLCTFKAPIAIVFLVCFFLFLSLDHHTRCALRMPCVCKLVSLLLCMVGYMRLLSHWICDRHSKLFYKVERPLHAHIAATTTILNSITSCSQKNRVASLDFCFAFSATFHT